MVALRGDRRLHILRQRFWLDGTHNKFRYSLENLPTWCPAKDHCYVCGKCGVNISNTYELASKIWMCLECWQLHYNDHKDLLPTDSKFDRMFNHYEIKRERGMKQIERLTKDDCVTIFCNV